MPATAPTQPIAPALFLLSFQHRDEIAGLAETAGWRVTAARREEGAGRRFISSGAAIAVVDLRDAEREGLDALAGLSATAEIGGAALIALLPTATAELIESVHAAGATHFLTMPFTDVELVQTLRFAARHVARISGGLRSPLDRDALVAGEAEGWRWRPGDEAVTLTAALAQRIGLVEGPVPVAQIMERIPPDGQRAAREAVSRLLRTGLATAFAHDVDGPEGQKRRIAHHIRLDVDEQTIVARIEEMEAGGRIGQREGRDPLTGLNDARAARRWIETQLGPGGYSPSRVVVLLVGISRFDMINAAFGRAAGDALLQGVARRIDRLVAGLGLRRRITARLAGAEFLIGMTGPSGAEEAMLLGRQITEAVTRPFVAGDHVVPLSAHVGIALAEDGEADSQPLLRRASAALAGAREGDGASIRLVSAEAEEASRIASQLEVDLRLALDKDEIEILFQPQVSIASGQITGVEALARWRHPRYGELGAVPLFAAAERSDYITQLSAHVQRKAITVAARWPAALRSLRLAVNVTAADIALPGFADGFRAMVDQTGFDPARLTVEVTESGLIEDLGSAADLLASLRAARFRVAIDDFGTGYSSLAYLKALPLDYLKIDKRLAEDITGSMRDRVVVRGVIEMARSLGLTVIAEGVETEAQLMLLAAEGCNLYQGFLCSPPLESRALARLIKGWAKV